MSTINNNFPISYLLYDKKLDLIIRFDEIICISLEALCSMLAVYSLSHFVSLTQDALDKSTLGNYSSNTRDSLSSWMPDCIGFNLIEAVLCHICRKERPGAVLVFLTGWEDISSLRDQLRAHPLLGDPNRVLLLTCHGSMATSEQVGWFINFSFCIVKHLRFLLL